MTDDPIKVGDRVRTVVDRILQGVLWRETKVTP